MAFHDFWSNFGTERILETWLRVPTLALKITAAINNKLRKNDSFVWHERSVCCDCPVHRGVNVMPQRPDSKFLRETCRVISKVATSNCGHGGEQLAWHS